MDTKKIRSALLNWYNRHKRDLPWRKTTDPYAIWVSEVMLQQTQVKTVIPYYHRFMERFPDLHALASSNIQDVLKLWEGLGYYSRARNFHRAAKAVVEKHHSRVPDTMEKILTLPGVGDYIASAVLSIAYEKNHPVVDGNVKRVLSRLLTIDVPVNKAASHKIFKTHAHRLISPKDPATFNQAIMEIGALICRPKNPICQKCPLSFGCGAFHDGTVDRYPARMAKPVTPHHHLVIGVILKKEKLLIVRRKLDGFLGGMWEFPGGRVKNKNKLHDGCLHVILDETNLLVGKLQELTQIRHAYTHFKITATVYMCRHISGKVKLKNAADHHWIDFSDLKNYPVHGANKKFFPALEHALTVIKPWTS